jgi:hypothetical protein
MWFIGLLLLNEDDKRTIGYALIDFASNLLFAEMICRHSVTKIVWDIYFVMPSLYFFITYTLLSMFSARVESNPDSRMYRRLLLAVLIGQAAMFIVVFTQLIPHFTSVNTKSSVTFTIKDQICAMLFVLKANIDMFFRAASSFHRTPSQLAANHRQTSTVHPPEHLPNHWLDRQNSLEVPAKLEIARQLMWLCLTVFQWLHMTYVRTGQEAWLFYAVCFHIGLFFGREFRDMVQRARVKQMMTAHFHRITAEELSRLQQEHEQCAICLNEHTLHDSIRIPCQHVFHAPCLSRALQATPRGQPSRCPICRANIQGTNAANSFSASRSNPTFTPPNTTTATTPSAGHMSFSRELFTAHFQSTSSRSRTDHASSSLPSTATTNAHRSGSGTGFPFLRVRIAHRNGNPLRLTSSSFGGIPVHLSTATPLLANIQSPSTSSAEDDVRIARTLAEALERSSTYTSSSTPSTSLPTHENRNHNTDGVQTQSCDENDVHFRQNFMDVGEDEGEESTSISDVLEASESDDSQGSAVREEVEIVQEGKEEEKDTEETTELDTLLRFLAQEITEETSDEQQPERKSRTIETALMVVDADDEDDDSRQISPVANGEKETEFGSVLRRRKHNQIVAANVSMSSTDALFNHTVVDNAEDDDSDRDAKRRRL